MGFFWGLGTGEGCNEMNRAARCGWMQLYGFVKKQLWGRGQNRAKLVGEKEKGGCICIGPAKAENSTGRTGL
jgi:hypothetical protein